MREAPANRVRVIRLSTGELEPGAIRVAEGNVILPVLIDKNDQRQLGGETFQELRRVLELLRFAVARQIDGQFLEGRFSLQVFDCGENNGRLVRIYRLDLRHENEMTFREHVLQRHGAGDQGVRRRRPPEDEPKN